jgi:hypothetical protein
MSGTALDHWLVRGYLSELDAALGGLPAAQARELKEQKLYATTVSGAAVDIASSSEILAEQQAAARPSVPLTRNGLDAGTWYRDMSTTIDDTRKVTGRLDSQLSSQADTERSHATRNLLFSGIATLILLLVLLISAVLARPLRR